MYLRIDAFALGDVALAQKLSEELQYEKEAGSEGEPEFLTAFNAQNVWKVRVSSSVLSTVSNVTCRLRTHPEMMKLRSAGSSVTKRTKPIAYENVYL